MPLLRLGDDLPGLPDGARYTRDALNPSTRAPIGVETQTVSPQFTMEFSDASSVVAQVTQESEVLSAPFRPQGIPAGKSIAPGSYDFLSGVVSYNPANSKKLAPSLDYRFGNFYSGDREGYSVGLRYRSNEHFTATLTFNRDTISLPQGVSFHTDLASLRLDTAFSTRMYLNAFIQYNSVTHQWLSNIRYDFVHHPLSDIYIVYNDTRFQNVLNPTAAQVPTRALILKVTHLLSF